MEFYANYAKGMSPYYDDTLPRRGLFSDSQNRRNRQPDLSLNLFSFAFRANAAAKQRQEMARILRKSKTVETQLRAAKKAIADGKVAVGSLILRRVAVSRPKSKFTRQATKEILAMQSRAQKELTAGSKRLFELRNSDTGDNKKAFIDKVRKEFFKFDKLRRDYRHLPGVGKRISAVMRTHRKAPAIAAALDEPSAAAMLAQAARLERTGKLCCAYHVYEQAARFSPAPSGDLAKIRLAKLAKSKEVLAGAKQCKELQWCHKTYRRAEKLVRVRPKKASDLFKQIVKRSPRATRIHLDARKQLRELAAR